jgi:hypothetical protein
MSRVSPEVSARYTPGYGRAFLRYSQGMPGRHFSGTFPLLTQILKGWVLRGTWGIQVGALWRGPPRRPSGGRYSFPNMDLDEIQRNLVLEADIAVRLELAVQFEWRDLAGHGWVVGGGVGGSGEGLMRGEGGVEGRWGKVRSKTGAATKLFTTSTLWLV